MSGLADALDHLRSTAAGERRAELDELAGDLDGGTLTGRRDLLQEVLSVAVDEAGDRVSHASTRLLRGEGSAGELRATMAELSGLLELLEALDPDTM